jgi:hypothetical protein
VVRLGRLQINRTSPATTCERKSRMKGNLDIIWTLSEKNVLKTKEYNKKEIQTQK